MNGPQALADLLEGRRPQLLAYIERRLGQALRRKVERTDIYQETAASAWAVWPMLDLGGRDPFGWLCQIAEQRIVDASRRFAARKRAARREVSLHQKLSDTSRELLNLLAAILHRRRDQLRVLRRRRGELVDLLSVREHIANQAPGRDEQACRLYAAIERLPPILRDVVHWRYVDGLPTKVIADRLGRTDGAVRVMLTRTLDRLHVLLGHGAAP